jgi:hypothetical protein
VLRLLGWAALGLLLLLGGLALALVWGVAGGGFGSVEHAGAVRPVPVAPGVVDQRAERQRSARQDLGGAGPAAAPGEQILFGDLHVHTTFSNDAFLFSLPLIQGEGAHPPADACDFARFCADLDFWSITDHAELITPRQWAETRESIRQCNAVAGDAANPDLVAFLGWEWTNMSLERERHFGHKNVILRDVEEGAVPARPIGTGLGLLSQLVIGQGLGQRIVPALLEFPGWERYLDFNRYVAEARAVETCPEGIDTRELPEDCREYAGTPEALFEKLAQWGLPALVIPHGLSWGIHAPPGAELDLQLTRARHDPARQRLLEVYSGHGASELYRPWRSAVVDASEAARCPEPSEGFTPCCWRAGELIRARCGDADADVCEVRVERARRAFLDASIDPVRFQIVPGATPEEWGGCGQLLDGFLPAFNYRPKMSAQYALALGGFGEGEEEPLRFRFGLISSSDNHYARAGTGYKEFSRPGMTDARAISNEFFAKLGEVPVRERTPEPASLEALRANRGLDSLPRAPCTRAGETEQRSGARSRSAGSTPPRAIGSSSGSTSSTGPTGRSRWAPRSHWRKRRASRCAPSVRSSSSPAAPSTRSRGSRRSASHASARASATTPASGAARSGASRSCAFGRSCGGTSPSRRGSKTPGARSPAPPIRPAAASPSRTRTSSGAPARPSITCGRSRSRPRP